MPSPPSLIIASYLVSKNIAAFPGNSHTWHMYYAKEPNDEIDPNAVITVYDNSPAIDHGRMRGGRWVEHQGINIRIRSIDQDDPGDAYQKGWEKGQNILDALADLRNTTVLVSGDATIYKVQCYTIGQGLVFLKEEDPIKKRQLFTINGGQITLWIGGL